MKEEYRYRVISELFEYKGRNLHKGHVHSISTYFGIKGLREGFLEKIDDEEYEDDELITQRHFIEALTDYKKNNLYYNESDNCLKFDNNTFIESTNIEIDNSNRKIQFRNCEFHSSLNLRNTTLNKIEFKRSVVPELLISKSNIQNININSSNIFEQIKINNKSVINEIVIYSHNKINFMQIMNSTFQGNVQMEDNNIINHIPLIPNDNNEYLKDIEIRNCKFYNKFDLIKNKFSSLLLIDNTFVKQVNILDNEFELQLNICDNTFQARIKISKADKIRGFTFGEIEPTQTRNWRTLKQQGLKINNINVFNFISNRINSFRLGYQIINKFTIDNLENNLEASEINFGDLKIRQKFTISNLRNYKRMRIYRINYKNIKRRKSFLNINNSTFGSAEFQEVNFNSFDKVNIFSSNLINIETIDVVWPENISAISTEQKRNTYRMLKHSALKQEDRIQALEFYAKEMDTYRQLLHEDKKKSKLEERIVLRFNKLTNNFGLTWSKPIFLIIILNTLFFWTLVIFNHYYGDWAFGVWTFENFFRNLDYYFQFFVPTNTVSNILNNTSCINAMEVLNFIKNILLTVLIFQTIVAFRKHTRKI